MFHSLQCTMVNPIVAGSLVLFTFIEMMETICEKAFTPDSFLFSRDKCGAAAVAGFFQVYVYVCTPVYSFLKLYYC